MGYVIAYDPREISITCHAAVPKCFPYEFDIFGQRLHRNVRVSDGCLVDHCRRISYKRADIECDYQREGVVVSYLQ